MHNVFLNNFESIEDVISQFQIDSKELDGISWIFASYGTESYQGDAFVLFEKDKKLYQVSGSHCSCNGLEDQWYPEETTLEVIGHLLNEGTLAAANNLLTRSISSRLIRKDTILVVTSFWFAFFTFSAAAISFL